MRFGIPGFRFRVKVRVSGLGQWIWVSGFGFRVLNSGLWDLAFRVEGCGLRVEG